MNWQIGHDVDNNEQWQLRHSPVSRLVPRVHESTRKMSEYINCHQFIYICTEFFLFWHTLHLHCRCWRRSHNNNVENWVTFHRYRVCNGLIYSHNAKIRSSSFTWHISLIFLVPVSACLAHSVPWLKRIEKRKRERRWYIL